jgi:chitinase
MTARRRTIGLLLAIVAGGGVLDGCASRSPLTAQEPVRGPRVVGYLASWGVRSKATRIAELPGDALTHVIYAFARVGADGRLALGDVCLDLGECEGRSGQGGVGPGGNFAQLRILKQRHPHLKLLVAVGGWTGSGRFSDVALTAQSRRTFAESAVDVVIRGQRGLFDGIDVDWEYPVGGGLQGNAARPEDRGNFTRLLEELRLQLDAQGARDGRRYLLTAATAAGPSHVANLELERVAVLLDWVNVMTYDYHAGSSEAHFNAPLYAAAGDPTPQLNVDATVRLYLDGGVSASKIVVGVPFYGRSYGRVPSTNRGLFQLAGGPAPREWGAGELDFDDLLRKRPEANGFRRHWESIARVPWLYNESTGTWITYDDVQSIGQKADYARARGLGGVMAWELGGDGDGRLVRTIHARLSVRER